MNDEVADRQLLVFAPGSIIPVQDAILDGFRDEAPEVEVVFHPPAQSGLLAAQIVAGAPADVFISANTRYLNELQEAGLAPAPRVLAGNRVALVVRADLGGSITTLDDLAREGLRVLVPPSASDPLGQYAEELFARAGLTEAMTAKRRRGEILEDLRLWQDGLTNGLVDAAIIYATSAAAFAPVAVTVELPASEDMRDRIAFAVGAITRNGEAHPAADRFVEFLTGPAGQRLLRGAGFLPAPPTAPGGAAGR